MRIEFAYESNLLSMSNIQIDSPIEKKIDVYDRVLEFKSERR
jgi:hypothetical protein